MTRRRFVAYVLLLLAVGTVLYALAADTANEFVGGVAATVLLLIGARMAVSD